MNLQQLAQLGEFLGGVSVLFTLIYLAIQLRGNTRAVQSAAAQQTHETLIQGYFEIAGNADLNRIFRTGTIDYNSIDENEAGQFFAFWSGTMYVAQNWIYQRDNGALDQKLVDSFLTGISSNFHSQGFGVFWDQRKATFSQEMVEWVEDIRATPPRSPGHVPFGINEQQ
jgi:hypothetical protein